MCSGPWSIVLCYTCGSNGTHKLCSSVKCDEKWMCETCTNTPGISVITSIFLNTINFKNISMAFILLIHIMYIHDLVLLHTLV